MNRPFFVTSLLAFCFSLLGLCAEAQEQSPEDKLRALDSNNDGAISEAEAGEKVWNRIAKLDANNDGRVSFLEFRSRNEPAKQQASKKPGKVQPPNGFTDQYTYKEVDGYGLSLFVYTPKGHAEGDKRPAVVCFHGGGWKGGVPGQFEQQCQHLAARGMVAITVEYRLTSKFTISIEDCVEDAKSAMRWVRANADKLGVDPDRVASAGGSAGGHLAACVMLSDAKDAPGDDTSISHQPNAMVLFNPVMVFAPHPAFDDAQNERIQAGLASRADKAPEKISPIHYVDKKQPPCIMFFGTKDGLLKLADVFAGESVKAGNSCQVLRYKDQGHGFFNYRNGKNPYYEKTLAEMDGFFVELGWLKQAE